MGSDSPLKRKYFSKLPYRLFSASKKSPYGHKNQNNVVVSKYAFWLFRKSVLDDPNVVDALKFNQIVHAFCKGCFGRAKFCS